MITSYQEYKVYFAMLGLAHPLLATQADGAGMVFFDSDRKLNRQRTVTRYPVLEVERPRPQMTIIEGGDHYKFYRAGFSVLEDSAVDDEHKQESIMNKLEGVVDQIIERLKEDEMVEGENLEVLPVRNYEHDNLWGWTVDFQIKVQANYCLDTTEWMGIAHLIPIWTPSATVLGITIEGITHSVAWNSSGDDDTKEALKSLQSLINSDVNISGGAYVMENQLLLFTGNTGESFTYTTPPSSHAWEEVRSWP